MDNRIFTRKDKTLNTIYRIILFACLAASAVTVYGILNVVIADNQNNLGKKILGMMIMTYGYYAVVVGSATAILFSVLSYKSGSVISVFFRTVSSLGILVLDLCGVKFMSVLKKASDIVCKYGIDYIKTNPSPEEVGLTQADFDKYQNMIDNTDEDMLELLFIGIFLGAAVYFILSLTSLHSLYRQRKNPVSENIPMDDELAQYYSDSGNDNINDL